MDKYPGSSFESGVNPEGIQTTLKRNTKTPLFESGVNPEGIQTTDRGTDPAGRFESGVNPEGIQTMRFTVTAPHAV